MIYTGALVNTGATLRLERADESLVDQVIGGADWELIGGDNVTKETAQYTTKGWVTAAATPGREAVPPEERVAAAVTPATSGSAKLQDPVEREPTILILPGVTLELEVYAPKIGYVNQPVSFVIEADGVGDHLIDSLSYEWNFGDGTVSGEKEPTHTYAFPGTYVVTSYAGYKRQEQVTRHEITILPVALSLTADAAGNIQINNDSPYEVDLSGFAVRGKDIFVFPPRSIILPQQTITLVGNKIGTTNSMVAVYDTKGVLLASKMPGGQRQSIVLASAPAPQVSSIAVSQPQEVVYVAPEVVVPQSSFGFVKDEVAIEAKPEEVMVTPAETQLAAVSAAATGSGDRWTYALIGVLVVAVLGILLSPRRNEIA
ncbi:PKD domain-containing protein [Candidatus Nomurabacteria bacterium]|nr:PKD domain-containing protein [Candidatus Nomurabacteria bacterium]